MKSAVILFLEQNPLPQRQEFPALLRIVVCICLVVTAVRLFLDSPSFWQSHQKHEERLSSVILGAVFSFF